MKFLTWIFEKERKKVKHRNLFFYIGLTICRLYAG